MLENNTNKQVLKIGNFKVGPGEPTFIIAEAGVNHNGDIKLALELVHAAKESGADCVKFQTFTANDLVSKSSPKAKYQLETTDPKQNQCDMLKALELKIEDFSRLKAECDKLDICFLSTPYNINDVDLLESINAPAYKIASAMSVESHLLRYVAKTRKPILVSTGMCNLDEVLFSVKTMREAGNNQILIFQCTTDYPAKLEDTNLSAMRTIATKTGALVGYSDHNESFTASIGSVALGAHAIERHFTIDKSMRGPDHKASSNPQEFKELVVLIREMEKALGSADKKPSQRELDNKAAMRRGIVAGVNLNKNHILTFSDIAFKRPIQGIQPKDYERMIGKRLLNDIDFESPINWSDLA